tara:strand:- start:490 stop:654 length:165 start_codon:yes stop_codon:yes gene_type:complete
MFGHLYRIVPMTVFIGALTVSLPARAEENSQALRQKLIELKKDTTNTAPLSIPA